MVVRFELEQHPEGSLSGVAVQAGITRRSNESYLLTSFYVRGAIEQLRWAGEDEGGGEGGRSDELWRHGCFEAFVRGPGHGYVELNLAPARRWAAYAFDSCRAGMRNAELGLHRQDWVRRDLSISRVEMHALWELPAAYQAHDWRVGLSVVLETVDGSKSYWALAHPPGKPDFHNPDCFIARLPAPAAT